MRDVDGKIVDRAALRTIRASARSQGKSFVFTNGCFDVLHVGHIEYLAFARKQGDLLAVGVNSDRSVRELKGPQRPVVPQEDRVKILAALECVDYVVIFDELHVDRLIAELLPDILVKGGDRADWVCGREIVEQNGGRVVLAPVAVGRSTTSTIANILRVHGVPKPG
jgi:D-beta-D-heptose 7-phosphate kinase/D-beta-D-heptose 1-phosphate adenosyltransferase